MQDWANEWGIKWVFHIPHHPQAAGLIERMNGLLKQKIKQLTPDHTLKKWNVVLEQAEFELNNRPIGGGQTPLQRMVGLVVPKPIPYLKVWKTHAHGVLPIRATPDSTGVDLITPEEITVPTEEQITVPLGIGVTVPTGTYGRIAPRSGLALKGIQVLGGVVDADYQGELKVILHNGGKQDLTCQAGQRIAQLICEKCSVPAIQGVNGPGKPTARGDRGFGSTDQELCSGQKVWVIYPHQPNRAGEIISRGPGSSYWVLMVGTDSPVCLDIGKLKHRE